MKHKDVSCIASRRQDGRQEYAFKKLEEGCDGRIPDSLLSTSMRSLRNLILLYCSGTRNRNVSSPPLSETWSQEQLEQNDRKEHTASPS